MTKKKQCFFLEPLGNDQVSRGLVWLFENSTPSGGWLAVNTKRVLEGLTEPSKYDDHKYEGLSFLRELFDAADNTAKISGAAIRLVTNETIPEDGEDKPLLVIGPSKNFLNKLDVIPNISKIMVTHYAVYEVDEWAKRNDAKCHYDIGNKSQSRNDTNVIELDQVVKVALGDVTNIINSFKQKYPDSYHLHFYFYYIHVVTSTLHILNQSGYDLDPTAIGRCLAEDYNWDPVSAKLADELAWDLKSAKTWFDTDLSGYWKKDENIIEKWKAKAG